jgi:ribosomal protein S18 acetylase RimI-like enzyme
LKSDYMVISNGFKGEFILVTHSLWDDLKEDIIEIEEESFSSTLCDSKDDLLKIVDSPTSIFLVLRIPSVSRIAGYIAADMLEGFADVPGTTSDPYFNQGKTIYIVSVAIHPDWRRRGFGNALQEECLRWASRRGFERVTAHIERGAAARMGLGARVLMSFANWYGTGRSFDYVEYSTSFWR